MKTINVSVGPTNTVTFQDSNRPEVVSSPAGSALDNESLITGESIPVGCLVVNVDRKAYRYDVTDPTHAYALVGIAIISAPNGGIVFVQPSGLVNHGWQPDATHYRTRIQRGRI